MMNPSAPSVVQLLDGTSSASDKLHSQLLSRHDFRRKWMNRLWMAMLVLATAVACTPLVMIFYYVFKTGYPTLNWAFFTELPKPMGEEGGGMANAIAGTGVLVGIASLVGIPWGVATGIYLSEYGKGKLATAMRFSGDILASVPSIVIGIFAYALFVKGRGFSAYAGGLALAMIMIPIVARTTEELLKLVPTHIREAGLGLGIPRWKVIVFVVFRGSLGGISTGVMLAIARAAGEAAPLLLTALGNDFGFRGLNQPISSIPVQIYNYAKSPDENWQRMAWSAAFLLMILVFAINLLSRLMIGKRPEIR